MIKDVITTLQKQEDRLSIAIFSFIVSLLIAIIYIISRWGFGISYIAIINGLSLSGYLLFVPILIDALLRKRGVAIGANWYTSFPAIIFITLFVLFAFAFLSHHITIFPFIAIFYLFSAMGIICGFFAWIRNGRFFQTLLFFLFPVLFTLWVIGPLYADIHHHPLFFESLVVGDFFVADTPFHAAIGHMLANFGFPSTGIDGVPKVEYYVASHWILFHTGRLVGVNAIDAYLLIYPIVFAPLLPAVIGWSALEFREIFQKSTEAFRPIRASILFWLILFIGLIGLLEFHPLHFIGESYLFSVWFSILTITLTAHFIKSNRGNFFQSQPSSSTVLFLIAIPLMLGLVGLSKTPAMFVLFGIVVVLFFRYGLFRRWYYLVGLALTAVTVYWVWNISVWEIAVDQGASIDLFHLLKCCVHPALRIIYYPIETLYLLIFIFWSFSQLKIKGLPNLFSAWKQHKLLAIEFSIVLLVVAISPSLLISLGRNALYFSEIQRWIGLIFLLSMLNNLIPTKEVLFRGEHRQVPTLLALSGLSIVFLIGFFVYTLHTGLWLQRFINLTHEIRTAYISIDDDNQLNTIEQLMETYLHQPNNTLSTTLEIFDNLATIGQSRQQGTMLYIPKTVTDFWGIDYQCEGISFIGPALSGLPMVAGYPVVECNPLVSPLTAAYHYSYYPDLFQEPLGSLPLSDNDLCARVLSKGFQQVLIVSTDEESNVLTRQLDCLNE